MKKNKYNKLWEEMVTAEHYSDKEKELAGTAVKQVVDKLKALLEQWPDKEHPYYKDIKKVVESSNPSVMTPKGIVHLPY